MCPFAWNVHTGALLNLSATLASGQNFRWRQDASGVWWGVVERTVAALWQQLDAPESLLYWQTFPTPGQWAILADYFRLDVDLPALYAQWIAAEPHIADAIERFRGLRILRQPPQECFFAFQCAACNTVVKIERSVHQLAQRYGEKLEAVQAFYAFPTLEALAGADETALRADLWGYRAPRVIQLARTLRERPEGWLESLRQREYAEAHAALTALHGVGAKLADCICLFSLDKDDAVPVDTHVRQIATRLFRPDLTNRSLTPKVYRELAEVYQERFAPWAGWAQQYLFFAELPRAQASSSRIVERHRQTKRALHSQ